MTEEMTKMTRVLRAYGAKGFEGTNMNKADVYRAVYNAAEFHLFGAGSWPADREGSVRFWKLLNGLGLTTAHDHDHPGTIQYTPFGVELNVELISIFAGAIDLWDVPLLLDLMGHLDDEEAEEIYSASPRHAEQVIHRHVLRVYCRTCNRNGYPN